MLPQMVHLHSGRLPSARISSTRLCSTVFPPLLFLVSLPVILAPLKAEAEPGGGHVFLISGDGVQPNVVAVPPGSTVIWRNNQQRAVRVRLDRPVSTLCRDPKSFAATARGASESDALPHGDFATLCFLEENDYPFEVESIDSGSGSTISRGTVRITRTLH